MAVADAAVQPCIPQRPYPGDILRDAAGKIAAQQSREIETTAQLGHQTERILDTATYIW